MAYQPTYTDPSAKGFARVNIPTNLFDTLKISKVKGGKPITQAMGRPSGKFGEREYNDMMSLAIQMADVLPPEMLAYYGITKNSAPFIGPYADFYRQQAQHYWPGYTGQSTALPGLAGYAPPVPQTSVPQASQTPAIPQASYAPEPMTPTQPMYRPKFGDAFGGPGLFGLPRYNMYQAEPQTGYGGYGGVGNYGGGYSGGGFSGGVSYI